MLPSCPKYVTRHNEARFPTAVVGALAPCQPVSVFAKYLRGDRRQGGNLGESAPERISVSRGRCEWTRLLTRTIRFHETGVSRNETDAHERCSD